MLVWGMEERGCGEGMAGHVGGTRGSCIVFSAVGVLSMRVVCGMRGVSGVWEMCMCLAREGGLRGEGEKGVSG